MRSLALSFVAVLTLWAAAAVPVFAQQPVFKLGFAQLADAIPGVGQPVENEHFNPSLGEALQQTTTGLMVWRKADNSTSFTNGATTFILGPLGVQERPNNTLFAWERPAAQLPLPTTDHSTPTISLGVDIQQLSTVPAGQELLSAATENRVLIGRDFLGPGVLGAFIPDLDLALISTRLHPVSSQVRAAVLAHELQHASDATSMGSPTTAQQCYAFETRAFARQAQVWEQLWNGNLPPDGANSYFAELNDVTLTVTRDPEAFARQLVERYRSECGQLPPQ